MLLARFYSALTRVCATSGSSGVPVGMQIAWLVVTSSGWPLEVTRAVPTTHCALTQGPGAGGTNGHPATSHGAAIVTDGAPESSTLGFGTVGCACPPCRHITVAPSCNTSPGTIPPSPGDGIRPLSARPR